MDKITSLLDKLSLDKILPKLDTILDGVQWMIEWSVKIGPICILVLGLIYLLLPPKEANRFFGFRTYFGMGSIPAWLFTQRIAGALMAISGLILFMKAKSAAETFGGMEYMQMAEKAFELIKVQIILCLVLYVFMFLLTFVMFNRKGVCRFPGIRKTFFGKLLIPVDPVYKKKKKLFKFKGTRQEPEEETQAPVPESLPEETEEVVEYERQGEQVITVDDIVIEGLDE